MKLPGVDEAVIESAKIREYLLSATHPVGRFKAMFFKSLGYSDSNWRRLEADLQQIARSGDATHSQESPYGKKYVVGGTLIGPSGRWAHVTTVWIVLTGKSVPRLVTVYPGAEI